MDNTDPKTLDLWIAFLTLDTESKKLEPPEKVLNRLAKQWLTPEN